MIADQDRKFELIDEVVEASVEHVDKEEREGLGRFIRKYFELVSPIDVLERSIEAHSEAILSLWEFGKVRQQGVAKIRFVTVDVDEEEPGHTRLEIVNDDMPFLVDSISSELGRQERTVHLVIHPVLTVRRDAEGRRVEEPEGEEVRESFMQFDIDRETAPGKLEEMRSRLLDVLQDVRAAVSDWEPMRERMRVALAELDEDLPVEEDEIEEAREFLSWLDDEHFTFLGYRRYDFVTEEGNDYLKLVPGSGLGILREVRPESAERGVVPFNPELSRFARRRDLVIVAKANSRATVHRPVHMDRISIKRFDDDGNVTGEHRFLGLFTSTAYSRSVMYIPMLRRKAHRILERAELGPNSHAGKALAQILETLPRDELFQMSEDDLYQTSLGILQLQERQRIALFVRRDVFDRFVSCLVYVPRDRYDSQLREQIKAILEVGIGGTVTAFYTQMTDSPLARAHFIVKTDPENLQDYDIRSIERLIAAAARNWSDHLRENLISAVGDEEGREIYHRYREAFPASYQERFTATEALHDIGKIEHLLRSDDELIVDLYERPDDQDVESEELHCKFINLGPALALSDIVPRLENMGLRVQMAVPHEVFLEDENQVVRIRDFLLERPEADIEFGSSQEDFEEAFLKAWSGESEDDGFNQLVLCAGLTWEHVLILRAYAKYLKQLGVTFSEAYLKRTLVNNPTIAFLLVKLFYLLFGPDMSDGERETADKLREEIEKLLDEVDNVDEDRILRMYVELIDSTLRTNFFQKEENGRRKPYLSFKFETQAIPFAPLPKPMFEIFVYSPSFEGVHLRSGKVARGGLRWSDRQEDFRQEVLGLVKAQIVKNAVIVPVGSKGGFVLKNPPSSTDREAFLAEGVSCYKSFLRGLLEITDNLVDGEVVPPEGVVRRDDDDTYLVVAADKGTATFSDFANEVAAEYDFWLGDAFASGGSAGYDHKKMGITARGAWEAVKRHFRELGLDTQSEDFTVVGVGDMSGDVFGNGMLLSQHIRLIAAFNHMHIFVDPDPDPKASWKERKRLFDMPRSSWADYDTKVMSKGGQVFDRNAKAITVSEEIRSRFDLESSTTTPNDLICAILRGNADLLWLGGIGTYVKQSEETHAEVHDRANDSIRVNADELRVRVVGEGANLGFTQPGRIEFATRGGKINTDAIDNSAGVDTSDHEVNIKIALASAVRQGDLTKKGRLQLLSDMTDEVSQLVLKNNYLQTQAISVAEILGGSILDQQSRLMRHLERKGRLDRSLEDLPDEEEIAERQKANRGLTRPEIAVLLAYAKIDIYEELLESDLPDDPLLVEDLLLYFPVALRDQYRTYVEEHRLRREIIATFVTNSMVNRVGPTFVSQMAEETGRWVSDIARAYTISRESFGLRKTWRKIEALDNKIDAKRQLQMLVAMQKLVERSTRWFLRNHSDLDITERLDMYGPRVMKLARSLDTTLPHDRMDFLRQKSRDHEMLGIPRSLSNRLAGLDVVGSFPDIVRIAKAADREVTEAGKVYFEVGTHLEFDTLRDAADAIAAESPWQRAAVAGLVEDLFAYQSEITQDILNSSQNGKVENATFDWMEKRAETLERTQRLLNEIRSLSSIDISMLAVAARSLRSLAR